MIPHKGHWMKVPSVALPGSKVMVIGYKWDLYNLTPWVYDLKKDTWSNKLNGEALPSLPKEELFG